MHSKYESVLVSLAAAFVYDLKMLENQCPLETEKKKESGLPGGQRCAVGY